MLVDKVWKNQNNILLSSEKLKIILPIQKEEFLSVETNRDIINNIISGKDSRKLLVIGPCSVDFEDSILEYAHFLVELQKKYLDKLFIVMRFYTVKPRTTIGWKWLEFSEPQKETDLNNGFTQCRKLALKLIQLWLPLANEVLYPQWYDRFNDLFSYITIGARSSENQFHREVASWIPFAVWIKNPTSGSISTMLNAIKTARAPHVYVIGEKIFQSTGNIFTHAILRWGKHWINYNTFHIQKTIKKGGDIENLNIIIDCSHENSWKNPDNQIQIIKETFTKTFKELSYNERNIIKWFIVESYIFDGHQSIYNTTLTHGLSLTDACIWKEKTKELIKLLYDLV